MRNKIAYEGSGVTDMSDVYREHSYCLRERKCSIDTSCDIKESRALFEHEIRTSDVADVFIEHSYALRSQESRPRTESLYESRSETFPVSAAQIMSEHSYAYSETFSFRSVNVNGLRSKLIIDEFIEECQTSDLNVFQEVKTDVIDEDEMREILSKKGLNILFKHRKKLARHRSGGLAIVFSSTLNCKIKELESDIQEVQWIVLSLNERKILIGIVISLLKGRNITITMHLSFLTLILSRSL